MLVDEAPTRVSRIRRNGREPIVFSVLPIAPMPAASWPVLCANTRGEAMSSCSRCRAAVCRRLSGRVCAACTARRAGRAQARRAVRSRTRDGRDRDGQGDSSAAFGASFDERARRGNRRRDRARDRPSCIDAKRCTAAPSRRCRSKGALRSSSTTASRPARRCVSRCRRYASVIRRGSSRLHRSRRQVHGTCSTIWADAFVTVMLPLVFFGISQFYARFERTSDDEVRARCSTRRGAGSASRPPDAARASGGLRPEHALQHRMHVPCQRAP